MMTWIFIGFNILCLGAAADVLLGGRGLDRLIRGKRPAKPTRIEFVSTLLKELDELYNDLYYLDSNNENSLNSLERSEIMSKISIRKDILKNIHEWN